MPRILDWPFNLGKKNWPTLIWGGLIFFILLLASCEKKPVIYSPVEWRAMASKHYHHIEYIFPLDPAKQVSCATYGHGCTVATIVRVKNMEFVVVEFHLPEQAAAEAKRIGQWFARNIVFDEVMGELMLEEFVRDVFEARPGVIYQRPYHTPLPRPEKLDHHGGAEESEHEAPEEQASGGGEHH